MIRRNILFGINIAAILIFAAGQRGFAQGQSGQERFSQAIVVNGQTTSGVYVRNNLGGMQAYTCANPQQYTTPDGSSRGWACYDPTTRTYLLNALPPSQTTSAAPQPQPQYQPQPQPQYQPAPLPRPTYSAPAYPGYPYGVSSFGTVKIDTKIKNGSVYIDGGFAGTIKKLKKFSLRAGNHDIELRDSRGETILQERVQIIPHRTVELRATNPAYR